MAKLGRHAVALGVALGAVLTAGLGTTGAARAERVQVPQGCTGFLTVQMKACGVSHYWRCDAAPEGTVWEAHYDADGPFSLSVYNAEFQWLDSQYLREGSREYLVEEGPDPASLSELLETGEDSYAFVIREDGPDGTRDVVHQGVDRLTGRALEIDGVQLLETEFASVAMDAQSGETLFEVFGNQYVLEQERLFFLGQDTFRRDGEESENDFSPVRFVMPGETGFEDMVPLYGCAAVEEIRHVPPLRQGAE